MNELRNQNLLSKQDSQAIKGLAICLMLAHHLFMHESFFQGMPVEFFIFSVPRMETLAMYARVCVPMFVFVTAYGYSVKMDSNPAPDMRGIGKIVLKRLTKLMIPFWFIFIVFQIGCNISGIRDYHEIYGGGYTGLFNFVIDALGLAGCSSTPTLNETWWYMALALLLIGIMPAICLMVKRFGFASLIAVLVLFRASGWDNHGFFNYLLVAVLGAVIYYCNFFGAVNRVAENSAARKTVIFVLILIFIFAGYVIKLVGDNTDLEYLVVIPALVLLQQMFFSRVKPLTKVLAFLGKYSMMMFLTHSFIKAYFFHDFIYSFKYGILIWLALMVTSLALAMVLEGLQKLFRINKLTDYLNNFIDNKC